MFHDKKAKWQEYHFKVLNFRDDLEERYVDVGNYLEQVEKDFEKFPKRTAIYVKDFPAYIEAVNFDTEKDRSEEIKEYLERIGIQVQRIEKSEIRNN